MGEKELQEGISKLEALMNEAFYKSNQRRNIAYSANLNGQYTAYHKAIELIKKAQKGEWVV